MIEAVKRIVHKITLGEIKESEINAEMFSSMLETHGIPDPEMLIRTSGEYRISNFLLWQLAYSELFFPTKLWPDFRKEDLYEAIVAYQCRERRFGKTSEQIIKEAENE
jgi:undecaprenyl diphosphate synthase